MKRVTVDLCVPGANRSGRALLERDLFTSMGVDELERCFAEQFADEEDEARLSKIEAVLRASKEVRVDVHPGETKPPEYHVYVRDPAEPQYRLFACVLAPEAVTTALLEQPPHLLFESATFQTMSSDTSTSGLLCAVEDWIRRLFPELVVPRIALFPWPIVEVVATQPPRKPLAGAPPVLERRDYPLAQEISA